MLYLKQKKNQSNKGGNRFLISVTVLGSAGPLRLVVKEDELVAAVIDTALKSYAREGRLPVLGTDMNKFMLYCPIAGTEALLPWETIGSVGVRNFILCKKPEAESEKAVVEVEKLSSPTRRAAAGLKAWFHRSLSLKSH